MSTHPIQIVVMGTAGSGKSTVGIGLANSLGLPFIDGDDLHSQSNREKMSAGIPLTDEDRIPWLREIGQQFQQKESIESGLVIAASCLKKDYRDFVRQFSPAVRFVYLEGTKEILMARLNARRGHFMLANMLESQLAILEPLLPIENGITVSVEASPEQIVQRITKELTK